MQAPELKTVDIQPPSYRKSATMLRNIADDIEAGTYGEVETIVVALQGDTYETFGGGKNADFRACAYLFAVGLHRLTGVAT